jgi:phenylpropionate dioxygenase-like ring-hydroxylating dioxygenase large terminal subunit
VKAGQGAWRAFEGPNGWYVAWEDADGYHHQPSHGGRLDREEAEAMAAERDDRDDEDDDALVVGWSSA